MHLIANLTGVKFSVLPFNINPFAKPNKFNNLKFILLQRLAPQRFVMKCIAVGPMFIVQYNN